MLRRSSTGGCFLLRRAARGEQGLRGSRDGEERESSTNSELAGRDHARAWDLRERGA